MSTGAIKAGVDVKIAVEIEKYAAITYKANHPNTILINDDIRNIEIQEIYNTTSKDVRILFGGPPCQGFSSSNQKTRNKGNETNWLFQEYIRITAAERPDWIIIENVKGIIETEGGYFFESILEQLSGLGYTLSYATLNAVDFGVPQIRNRVFIVGSLHGIKYEFPKPIINIPVTIQDAISDLPVLENGASYHELEYRTPPQNSYQINMRTGSEKSINNYITANHDLILRRFKHIPQGGNWKDIPAELMGNYKDFTRCHTGIYHRLSADKPSVVIGNYRKNMLIHPTEHRGLSVREAARIQSFPDVFHFYGSIGFQQQQVGNSAPPILAEKVFSNIIQQTV